MKAELEALLAKLTGLINFTTPESGFPVTVFGTTTSNCVKVGNLKIQFGVMYCQSGQYQTITFKEPFASVGYVAFASYTATGVVQVTQPSATITNQHTDYCSLYTAGGNYCWLCIGY